MPNDSEQYSNKSKIRTTWKTRASSSCGRCRTPPRRRPSASAPWVTSGHPQLLEHRTTEYALAGRQRRSRPDHRALRTRSGSHRPAAGDERHFGGRVACWKGRRAPPSRTHSSVPCGRFWSRTTGSFSSVLNRTLPGQKSRTPQPSRSCCARPTGSGAGTSWRLSTPLPSRLLLTARKAPGAPACRIFKAKVAGSWRTAGGFARGSSRSNGSF